MPALAFYWPTDPRDPRDEGENASLDQIQLWFNARMSDLVPEYMPDPWVMVCPSDPSNGMVEDNPDSSSCIAITDRYPCPGSGRVENSCGGVECGQMGWVDESYYYIGWALDKFGKNMFLNVSPSGQNSVEDIINILAALNEDDPVDMSAVKGPAQIAQVFECFLNDWVPGCLAPILGEDWIAAQDCINRGTDSDQRPVVDPDDTSIPYGNGSTDTIFRLREGIERFLITDINNPGASAKAQSQLWIMIDALSTDVEMFSHVPGGSNVLYLDGHVQFVRYPTAGTPISRDLAAFVGALSAAL
jgi:prepilin-type processing-associated H-X9-DG protein